MKKTTVYFVYAIIFISIVTANIIINCDKPIKRLSDEYNYDVDDIVSGNYCNTKDFSNKQKVIETKGKYINFYVENKGTDSIKLKMKSKKDSSSKILKVGEKETISVKLSSSEEKIKYSVRSAKKGEQIKFYYKLYQRFDGQ